MMRVGIIGCGVMGSALARMIIKKHEVILYDHKKSHSEPLSRDIGAKVCFDLNTFAKQVEVVILAIKPKQLIEVAEDLDPLLNRQVLLLSILAGTPLEVLQASFSNPTLFRLMPNLPLICGKGMIGIVEESSQSLEDRERVQGILQDLGKVSWLPESLINAFTALTGSNPAFIYLIIEAMVEAGISIGIKASEAQELILGTMEGAIELLQHTQESPESLRWKIASPGGTTIAGLNELEAQKVRHGVIRGIQCNYEKASEMEN